MDGEGPTSSATADPLRAVELLGRETPAGKALFRLYKGSDVGRQKGQQLSDANKKAHERKLATGWTPEPVTAPSPPKVVRPTVAVPTVGRKQYNLEDRPKYIPHRKPGELIKAEMREDADRQRSERPPPRGPLLDEAEKERCSRLMEHRGKVPEAPTPPPPKPRKTERQELQELFDAVVEEIEERRAFLKDLEKAGALKKDHVFQVRADISERVLEMAKLDRMLKELDTR